jgi:hypothetical protein
MKGAGGILPAVVGILSGSYRRFAARMCRKERAWKPAFPKVALAEPITGRVVVTLVGTVLSDFPMVEFAVIR